MHAYDVCIFQGREMDFGWLYPKHIIWFDAGVPCKMWGFEGLGLGFGAPFPGFKVPSYPKIAENYGYLIFASLHERSY